TTASCLLASFRAIALLVFARVTLTFCSARGVMTMKMMSSTSITSTIGVTLMLELTLLPSSLFTIAILDSVLPVRRSGLGEDCRRELYGPCLAHSRRVIPAAETQITGGSA